jgi:flagellar biosynthesis/type III secretory pathway M-ring protein FliF/YscJ
LLALAGLLVLFGGVFPLLRRIDAGQATIARLSAAAVGGGVAPPPSPPRPRLAAAPRPPGSQDVFSIDAETVRTLVTNDPARTDQVIREWIGRDRSQLRPAG